MTEWVKLASEVKLTSAWPDGGPLLDQEEFVVASIKMILNEAQAHGT